MPSLETGDGSGEFLPQRHKDTTISNHEKHESINSSRFNFVSDTKHILGFISPILGRRGVTT